MYNNNDDDEQTFTQLIPMLKMIIKISKSLYFTLIIIQMYLFIACNRFLIIRSKLIGFT